MLTDEQIDAVGVWLYDARRKYGETFGEPYHGTMAQSKALVALSGSSLSEIISGFAEPKERKTDAN